MNEDQKLAFDLVKSGKNIFITGSAGTGKSFVLKEIIKSLKEKYQNNHLDNTHHLVGSPTRWAVTSLTGVSSIPINGRTLHSWAGIGLGEGTVDQLVKKIYRFRKVSHWVDTKVLIIDEISMMDLELFEKLHQIGCRLRKNQNELFGGIQIVMSGDFLQLPPVGIDQGKFFCFESPIWKEYVKHTICLTQIFRQDNPVFQDLLSRIRLGIVTLADMELLQCRIVAKVPMMNVKPTKLYPFKKDVKLINEKELQKLVRKGEELHSYFPEYEYRDTNNDKLPTDPTLRYTILGERTQMKRMAASYSGRIWEKISKQPWNTVKQFTKGCQVMLNYNLDVEARLVNGSRGVILDFDITGNPVILFDMGDGTEERHTIPKVSYEEQFTYYTILINQYPLNLAWSTTIHKSQSQTLSKVVTDLSCIFSPGQTYVCLSRVRSLEGLYLLAIDFNKIWAHPKALSFYHGLGYECQVQADSRCQRNPFVPTSAYPGQNEIHPGVCEKCYCFFLCWVTKVPMEIAIQITKYLQKSQ